MKRVLVLAALLLAGCGSSSGSAVPARAPVALPNPALTPGATNPAVTPATVGFTICRRGWTTTIRPPVTYTEPIKRRLMRLYGRSGPLADYELDHLIPLELGGNPFSTLNLWPQPYERSGLAARDTGSETKDRLENRLRAEVCAGQLALATAQQEIARDWYQAWLGAGRP